jgi:hypothetical protein
VSSSVVAAAVLWVAVTVRLPTVTRGAAQRYLFVALTALAVGLTLDIPQITARLPELTGAGPNVPHLAKHLLVVVAAGAVREVVRSIALSPAQAATHRARRVLTTVGAVGALSVMFTRAPVHEERLPGLTTAAVGDPVLLFYWMVYLVALASALVGIARVAFTAVRTYPASRVRTGMVWMGAGSVLGLAYCAHKAIYLAAATSGIAVPDADTMDSVQSALLTLTALALVIGLLWPTVTGWPVLRHVIAFRAYRKLHPLWQVYVEAEPDIAFDNTGKARLRDIEFRLYRRIIEIRDGMLAVRPYASARLREIAMREAKRAGHKNPDLVGDAAWLELARRAKLKGDPPCQDSVPVTAGGADPSSETHLLTRIATAWPAAQAIAERVDAPTGTEPSSR